MVVWSKAPVGRSLEILGSRVRIPPQASAMWIRRKSSYPFHAENSTAKKGATAAWICHARLGPPNFKTQSSGRVVKALIFGSGGRRIESRSAVLGEVHNPAEGCELAAL